MSNTKHMSDLDVSINMKGIIDGVRYMHTFGVALTDGQLSDNLRAEAEKGMKAFGEAADRTAATGQFRGEDFRIFHVYRWPDSVRASAGHFNQSTRLFRQKIVKSKSAIDIVYTFTEDTSKIPMLVRGPARRSRHIISDKAIKFETKTREKITPGTPAKGVTAIRRGGHMPKMIPVKFRDETRFYRKGTNFFSQNKIPNRRPLDFNPRSFLIRAPLGKNANVEFGYGTKGQFSKFAMTFWKMRAIELQKIGDADKEIVNIAHKDLIEIAREVNNQYPLFTTGFNGIVLRYGSTSRRLGDREINLMNKTNGKMKKQIEKEIKNALK